MPSAATTRSVRILLVLFFAIASLYYISRSYTPRTVPSPIETEHTYPQAEEVPQHADDEPASKQIGRKKAAFVSLIRNGELWEIAKTIRQVEDRFNHKYHYPWVFLNDVPFTDEFIKITSALVSGETKYGICL
jgi:alpha 1,2-mannosyltransferase